MLGVLYLRDLVASVARPIQQLVDFQKIEFAPGEEKTVTFMITEPMLRFYTMDGVQISEKGTFQLMVGYADHFLLRDQFRFV